MKRRLAILLVALALVLGVCVGTQVPGPTLIQEATPNAELQAFTEAMVLPSFEEAQLDPAAIDSAWDKAMAVGGPEVFDTERWDAQDMMVFKLYTKQVRDQDTGQRVWSHTQAIPALDPVTGVVTYKEFVMLFLSAEEQQAGTIERLLVSEMLKGLFNRRMLVDPSIPPLPGIQHMIVGEQMEEVFGPDWNRHPVPEAEGGPAAGAQQERPLPPLRRMPNKALEGQLKA